MRDPGGRVVLELRRLGAAQRGDHAGEDDRQPVAARVDDAGVAQDLQQVGAALDAVLARGAAALEHGGDHLVLLLLRTRSSSRGASMWAISLATRWAISRTTVRIVPSAGSRTDP